MITSTISFFGQTITGASGDKESVNNRASVLTEPGEKRYSPTARAAAYLFPRSEWTDKNNNNKVEIEELAPSTEEEIELFAVIDSNRDRKLTRSEIDRYACNGNDVDINMPVGKIYDSLMSEGSYTVKGLPIIFITDRRIPKEIESVGDYSSIISDLQAGYAKTLGISRENGHLGGPTDLGKIKYVMIIYPKNRLDTVDRKYVESTISHELAHARQYLSGQKMRADSILEYMKRSGEGDVDLIIKVSNEVPSALGEIEAYRIDLEKVIKAGDKDRIGYFTGKLNRQINRIRNAENELLSQGAAETVLLVDTMLDEILPKTAADNMNKQISRYILPSDSPEKFRIVR